MDTTNKFMVTSHNSEILIIKNPPQRLSREDALNLAAWIKVMIEINDDITQSDTDTSVEFEKLCTEIKNT